NSDDDDDDDSQCQTSASFSNSFNSGAYNTTTAVSSSVVSPGLSHGQASAAVLHDPFMLSKLLSPRRLLYNTKFDFWNKVLETGARASCILDKPFNTELYIKPIISDNLYVAMCSAPYRYGLHLVLSMFCKSDKPKIKVLEDLMSRKQQRGGYLHNEKRILQSSSGEGHQKDNSGDFPLAGRYLQASVADYTALDDYEL
ncbi:hypothetical protein STEG23_011806, partial [Scotinomys teguina]